VLPWHLQNGSEQLIVSTAPGHLWACGFCSLGQLGIPGLDMYSRIDVPVRVPLPSAGGGSSRRVCKVRQSFRHTVVVCDDGSVLACGQASHGQCGDVPLDILWDLTPLPVPPGVGIVDAAVGIEHTLLLTDDGRVLALGRNDFGACGVGTAAGDAVRRPTAVAFGDAARGADGAGAGHGGPDADDWRVVQVAAGYHHSACVFANGRVAVWGKGDLGQLGIGVPCASIFTPVVLGGDVAQHRVRAASLGAYFSLFVTDGGKLFACGRNKFGNLGLGHLSDVAAPVLVPLPDDLRVRAAAGGFHHSVLLASVGGADTDEPGAALVAPRECDAVLEALSIDGGGDAVDDVAPSSCGDGTLVASTVDGDAAATDGDEHVSAERAALALFAHIDRLCVGQPAGTGLDGVHSQSPSASTPPLSAVLDTSKHLFEALLDALLWLVPQQGVGPRDAAVSTAASPSYPLIVCLRVLDMHFKQAVDRVVSVQALRKPAPPSPLSGSATVLEVLRDVMEQLCDSTDAAVAAAAAAALNSAFELVHTTLEEQLCFVAGALVSQACELGRPEAGAVSHASASLLHSQLPRLETAAFWSQLVTSVAGLEVADEARKACDSLEAEVSPVVSPAEPTSAAAADAASASPGTDAASRDDVVTHADIDVEPAAELATVAASVEASLPSSTIALQRGKSQSSDGQQSTVMHRRLELLRAALSDLIRVAACAKHSSDVVDDGVNDAYNVLRVAQRTLLAEVYRPRWSDGSAGSGYESSASSTGEQGQEQEADSDVAAAAPVVTEADTGFDGIFGVVMAAPAVAPRALPPRSETSGDTGFEGVFGSVMAVAGGSVTVARPAARSAPSAPASSATAASAATSLPTLSLQLQTLLSSDSSDSPTPLVPAPSTLVVNPPQQLSRRAIAARAVLLEYVPLLLAPVAACVAGAGADDGTVPLLALVRLLLWGLATVADDPWLSHGLHAPLAAFSDAFTAAVVAAQRGGGVAAQWLVDMSALACEVRCAMAVSMVRGPSVSSLEESAASVLQSPLLLGGLEAAPAHGLRTAGSVSGYSRLDFTQHHDEADTVSSSRNVGLLWSIVNDERAGHALVARLFDEAAMSVVARRVFRSGTASAASVAHAKHALRAVFSACLKHVPTFYQVGVSTDGGSVVGDDGQLKALFEMCAARLATQLRHAAQDGSDYEALSKRVVARAGFLLDHVAPCVEVVSPSSASSGGVAPASASSSAASAADSDAIAVMHVPKLLRGLSGGGGVGDGDGDGASAESASVEAIRELQEALVARSATSSSSQAAASAAADAGTAGPLSTNDAVVRWVVEFCMLDAGCDMTAVAHAMAVQRERALFRLCGLRMLRRAMLAATLTTLRRRVAAAVADVVGELNAQGTADMHGAGFLLRRAVVNELPDLLRLLVQAVSDATRAGDAGASHSDADVESERRAGVAQVLTTLAAFGAPFIVNNAALVHTSGVLTLLQSLLSPSADPLAGLGEAVGDVAHSLSFAPLEASAAPTDAGDDVDVVAKDNSVVVCRSCLADPSSPSPSPSPSPLNASNRGLALCSHTLLSLLSLCERKYGGASSSGMFALEVHSMPASPSDGDVCVGVTQAEVGASSSVDVAAEISVPTGRCLLVVDMAVRDSARLVLFRVRPSRDGDGEGRGGHGGASLVASLNDGSAKAVYATEAYLPSPSTAPLVSSRLCLRLRRGCRAVLQLCGAVPAVVAADLAASRGKGAADASGSAAADVTAATANTVVFVFGQVP
jgi:hypothetical protein